MIKFIKKHFPKLYNYLRKKQFLNDFLGYIGLFKIVYKKERSMLRFFVKTTFSYYIMGNQNDITFNFHGNKITMPRHLRGLDGFIEVWTDKFYDKIQGFEKVLDIGGYIGDSALRFSKNNKNVVVYEAHPDNFRYLKKNTKSLQNVKIYNKAVTGDKSIKTIKFYGGSFNMAAGTGNSQNIESSFIIVPAVSIIDILKETDYDALKMDIEGAEYDCFDAIMKNGDCHFNFRRGFIEFHLFKDKEYYLEKLKLIIEWLINKKYNIEYYDVVSNEYFDGLENLQHDVFLIYFNLN